MSKHHVRIIIKLLQEKLLVMMRKVSQYYEKTALLLSDLPVGVNVCVL